MPNDSSRQAKRPREVNARVLRRGILPGLLALAAVSGCASRPRGHDTALLASHLDRVATQQVVAAEHTTAIRGQVTRAQTGLDRSDAKSAVILEWLEKQEAR